MLNLHIKDLKNCLKVSSFLTGLFGFYGISTFVGYSMPNPFLHNQFYSKQFSLRRVHSLSKTFIFQAIHSLA